MFKEENDIQVDGEQFLTFFLKKDTFAIAIDEIREIIEYHSITKVPQMQPFIVGVTNIRGNVIPVVDLTLLLGIGEGDHNNKTCIIVDKEDEGEKLEIGLMVDLVDQVYDISPSSSEEVPGFGTKVSKHNIKFMGKINDEFVTVLNLHNILAIESLSENIFKY